MDDSKKDISQIKKYLQGDLDARAMHQLEREAQDDPFLMDAMEGFEATGTDAFNFNELDARLQERIAQTKVRRLIPWRYYAAAAAVLLFFSIGFMMWPKQVDTDKALVADLVKPAAPVDKTDVPVDTISKTLEQGTTKLLAKQARRTPVLTSTAPRPRPVPIAEPVPASVEVDTATLTASIAKMRFKQDTLTLAFRPDAALAQKTGSVFGSSKESTTRYQGVAKPKESFTYNYNASLNKAYDSLALKEISIPGLPKLTDKDLKIANNQSQVLTEKVKDLDLTTPPKASSTLVKELGMPVTPNLAVASKKETQDAALGRFNAPVSAQAGASDRAKEAQERRAATATVGGFDKIKNDNIKTAHPKMGWDAYNKYLKAKAISTTSGTVRISFTVDAKGTLGDFHILKGVNEAIDKKAVELIRTGPAWAPDVSGQTKTITQKVVFSKE